MDNVVILSGLVDLMVEKLSNNTDIWERDLGSSISDEIRKLQSTLLEIKGVVEDMERISKLDLHAVRGIHDDHLVYFKLAAAYRRELTFVANAAFDADDVVFDLQFEERRRRFEVQNKRSNALSIIGKVLDLLPSLDSISFRIKIARKIEEILTSFERVLKTITMIIEACKDITCDLLFEETPPFEIDRDKAVYGREKDKEEIIDFLINTDDDKSLSVLPIVGLPGVGKTTLALLVYADERIKQHFDLQVWVYVGEYFDSRYLALQVLDYATQETCCYFELGTETIYALLQQLIDQKRFLLVLDDVRNVQESEWGAIKYVFESGMLGNKVVVTTCSMTVASVMCPVVTPYCLQTLSQDDCWIIFKERISVMWIYENPDLEEIGKKIIKKCGGFPSAAKALGYVMASKDVEREWLHIKQFDLGARDEVSILTTILSNDWPNSFKRCFSYFSLFPKGYNIDRSKIIQLWIAEEFIVRHRGEDMHAEDIGNQWFNGFLTSFFDYEGKDDLDNVISFRMNSAMHYLAHSLAGNNFFRDPDREIFPQYNLCAYRYFSAVFGDDFFTSLAKLSHQAGKLRSLLVFPQSQYASLSTAGADLSVISNLINLRVLLLCSIGISNLPSTIGKLKHLRFLDLSKNMIATPGAITCISNLKQLRFLDLSENLFPSLPDSITTLYNLETLILQGCTELQELPDSLSNMSSLRHFDISKCDGLTSMPRELGRLNSLRTIPLFIVGEEPGRSIVELQHLNQLRGRLRIEGLCNLKNKEEVIEANLEAKKDLQCLELCWNRDVAGSPPPTEEVEKDIVDNLQPHPNVRVLRIKNYNGYSLPDWLTKINPSSPFANLEELSLHSLKRCENFSQLSQMPSLKRLDICCMDTIKIGREFYGSAGTFPSLEFLSLCDLPNLIEWFVPETDVFSSLQSLEISWCPKLKTRPSLPSSIVKLVMISSNEELLAAEGAFEGLSRLKKLIISGFEPSKCGLDGLRLLTSLKELTFSSCPQLTCLPVAIMQHFPSLHTLELEFNTNLMSLLYEGDHPPLFFAALHHLIIVGCSSLTTLPEWLGGLSSLQTLKLICCKKLSMLPDRIRCIKTLRQLTIDCCPILERRCKEGGDDWYKIGNIPNICINST